jgi:hypothetical protein
MSNCEIHKPKKLGSRRPIKGVGSQKKILLAIVWYKCKAWSVTLKGGCSLVGNSQLRKVIGRKREIT